MLCHARHLNISPPLARALKKGFKSNPSKELGTGAHLGRCKEVERLKIWLVVSRLYYSEHMWGRFRSCSQFIVVWRSEYGQGPGNSKDLPTSIRCTVICSTYSGWPLMSCTLRHTLLARVHGLDLVSFSPCPCLSYVERHRTNIICV